MAKKTVKDLNQEFVILREMFETMKVGYEERAVSQEKRILSRISNL